MSVCLYVRVKAAFTCVHDTRVCAVFSTLCRCVTVQHLPVHAYVPVVCVTSVRVCVAHVYV